MKAYFLAAVAAMTIYSAAYASDLPSKKASGAVASSGSKLYDWSGAYVGINGGYGASNSDITNVQFGSGTLYSYPEEDGSFKMSGGLVGAQLGYNYQAGNMVYGFDADFDFGNMKGSYAFPDPNQINLDGELQSIGTVRARFGYAMDNLLIFATGGLAYGSTKAALSSVTPPVVTASGSKSYMGYTVGGGIEYGLTKNWTVKAEYLYVDLGKQSNTYTFTGDVAEAAADTSLTSNIVRVGLNYKF